MCGIAGQAVIVVGGASVAELGLSSASATFSTAALVAFWPVGDAKNNAPIAKAPSVASSETPNPIATAMMTLGGLVSELNRCQIAEHLDLQVWIQIRQAKETLNGRKFIEAGIDKHS